MKNLQNFDLDELIHYYGKASDLEDKNEVLKAVICSMLEFVPNKEITIWFPELWDAVEASKLKIEEVACICCEENGLRFYIDYEN